MRKRIDLQADGGLDLNPQYTTCTSDRSTPEDIAAEEAAWASLGVITDESILNDYLEAEKALTAARKRLLDHAAPQPLTDEEREGLAAARLWWAKRRARRDTAASDTQHGINALCLDWDFEVETLSEPGPSPEEIAAAVREALEGDVITFGTHEEFSEWLRKTTVLEVPEDSSEDSSEDSQDSQENLAPKKSNEIN